MFIADHRVSQSSVQTKVKDQSSQNQSKQRHCKLWDQHLNLKKRKLKKEIIHLMTFRKHWDGQVAGLEFTVYRNSAWAKKKKKTVVLQRPGNDYSRSRQFMIMRLDFSIFFHNNFFLNMILIIPSFAFSLLQIFTDTTFSIRNTILPLSLCFIIIFIIFSTHYLLPAAESYIHRLVLFFLLMLLVLLFFFWFSVILI